MRKTTLLQLTMFLVGSSFAGCAANTAEPSDLEVAGSNSELRRDTDNDGHDDDDDFWYCGGNYGRDKHNRNKCPAVAALAQPPAVKVGQSTRLKGFAVDIDGPRKLKYNWTASPANAGQIANATSKRTSFKCLVAGKVHLTLSVTDGDCTRTAKVDVTCQPTTQTSCGDGAKNGNELCDNSDPDAADKCPASCNDNVACTTDALSGSAAQCNAQCSHTAITACKGADGCCAPGCNPSNDSDCQQKCGDGAKTGTESCDSSDPDAADKCPTSCNDGDACTTDSMSGSGAACTAVCNHTKIPGCGVVSCGDGSKNGSETCDNSDPDAADKCPASCDDGVACTVDSTAGAAATCDLTCGHRVITACTSGDGCCASGCKNPANGGTDNDCPVVAPSCGDGAKNGTEACDNSSPNAADKCPTTCNDGKACTTDTLVGSAADCTAMCTATAVTTCSATADSCCPSNCNANNDTDCVAVCGNNVVEPSGNETCDPVSGCPTACNDGVACTKDILVGDPTKCTSACTTQPITACTSGDGCCAPGCRNSASPGTGGIDNDCPVVAPSCGDGAKNGSETCDNTSSNPADKCPTSCNDNVACTTDTQSGAPETCDIKCTHTTITQCTNGAVGDACCPAGCNATNDGDCAPACGDGAVQSGETCDPLVAPGCPTAALCDDGNACTADTIDTDPAATALAPCNTKCGHTPLTTPACLCGNGKKDGSETCDGADCDALIAACDDHNPCTIDTVTGSKATCDVGCTHATSTTPECQCGDGVKQASEACDDSSPNTADKCPTAASCTTTDGCSPKAITGSASTCSAVCTTSTITVCKSGDMCCPGGAATTCNKTAGVIDDAECPSGPPPDPCTTCETAPRSSNNCRDSLNRCNNFPDSVVAGGAALCKAEVDCIHRTKCAVNAPSDCLCGDGVDPFDCFTATSFTPAAGTPPGGFLNGVCKAEILAAAGSQLPAILNTAFFDPTLPSGAADTVIETCDAFFCVAECLTP